MAQSAYNASKSQGSVYAWHITMPKKSWRSPHSLSFLGVGGWECEKVCGWDDQHTFHSWVRLKERLCFPIEWCVNKRQCTFHLLLWGVVKINGARRCSCFWVGRCVKRRDGGLWKVFFKDSCVQANQNTRYFATHWKCVLTDTHTQAIQKGRGLHFNWPAHRCP